MLQFQGMIAEYERAQILERSRRGKRHRAKAGEVSVLGGAPYGYRYIRKTSEASARYEIDAAEAEVVRLVYDKYTVGGLSIGAIARLLRGMGVPTRRRVPAGNDRSSGRSCATRPIRERPASTRRRSARGKR